MTIEASDNGGLICGFYLQPHGPALPMRWDAKIKATSVFEQPVWLHFNLADARANKWINAAE